MKSQNAKSFFVRILRAPGVVLKYAAIEIMNVDKYRGPQQDIYDYFQKLNTNEILHHQTTFIKAKVGVYRIVFC